MELITFKKIANAYLKQETGNQNVKPGLREECVLLDLQDIELVTKWALRLQKLQKRFNELDEKYEALKEMHLKAYEAFRKREHGEARRILGWTTGKRRPIVNYGYFFHEYLCLIKGGYDFENCKPIPAVTKEKALKILKKRHFLASDDAALQMLKRAIRYMKRRGIPAVNFKGLLPNTWERAYQPTRY